MACCTLNGPMNILPSCRYNAHSAATLLYADKATNLAALRAVAGVAALKTGQVCLMLWSGRMFHRWGKHELTLDAL